MESKALLNEASFESKKSFKLPEGAEVISETKRVTVREIENGFVLSMSCDLRYKRRDDEGTQYEYYTKEYFSKDNPLKITMPKEKSLAEKLD
jgi:hypothetical protein